MAVVHVFRGGFTADGAQALLLLEHPVGVGRADPVAPHEVVVPAAAVEPLTGLLSAHVVAGLAVDVPPVLCAPVAREVLQRQNLLAVTAALLSFGQRLCLTNRLALAGLPPSIALA